MKLKQIRLSYKCVSYETMSELNSIIDYRTNLLVFQDILNNLRYILD